MISIKIDEKNKKAVITMISSLIEMDDCTEVFLKTKSDKEEDIAETFKEDNRTVSDLLQDIGIPCHLLGYKYLKDAVFISLERPEALRFTTKLLYPEIAKINNVSWRNVERAIRHSIERAFDFGNIELLEKMFGSSYNALKGKVTNKQFITKLCEMTGANYEY